MAYGKTLKRAPQRSLQLHTCRPGGKIPAASGYPGPQGEGRGYRF